ncbi:CbtA family protein [Thalassospira sp.]|uniref:CbtA family protein n=1 Tax=Thalassospira sp. TaxID=1912094 RepID=UPI003AA975D4
MIQRILFAAIFAGVLGGVFISAAQHLKVTPLILEAETYEEMDAGAATPEPASAPHDISIAGHDHTHDHAGITANTDHDHAATMASEHHHDENAWAPQDGFERVSYTLLANIVIGVGYALLLCAGIVLRGKDITIRQGIMWGMGGFMAFSLFPALGLPPELPGSVAAPLEARQIWWLSAAIGGAAGLALIAFGKGWVYKLIGLVAIITPHIYGAPHVEEALGGALPAELAAEFAIASIITSAAFWLVLGGLSGAFLARRPLSQT